MSSQPNYFCVNVFVVKSSTQIIIWYFWEWTFYSKLLSKIWSLNNCFLIILYINFVLNNFAMWRCFWPQILSEQMCCLKGILLLLSLIFLFPICIFVTKKYTYTISINKPYYHITYFLTEQPKLFLPLLSRQKHFSTFPVENWELS